MAGNSAHINKTRNKEIGELLACPDGVDLLEVRVGVRPPPSQTLDRLY